MMKTLIVLAGLLCGLSVQAAKPPTASYTYSRVGNANVDVPGPLPGGVVMMGGGTDVGAAFQWLCGRSGNGDFLVLRATGKDTYNAYVRKLCPNLNSVATLIIPSRAAAVLPEVAAIIRQAEVIWIAGGDQSDYVNYWQGTGVTAALDDLIGAGAPIGGTSAGLDVLTQYVYSALAPEGVTSAQALADPFHPYLTLARDFVNLPVLAGIIGDSHFAARDRMGRNLAFLCRLNRDFGVRAPHGIAVDEATALLIDEYGKGRVVNAPKSTGKVYFLQAGAPEACAPGQPLTYRGVQAYRIDSRGRFDVYHWWQDMSDGTAYTLDAVDGVLSSSQPGGAIY